MKTQAASNYGYIWLLIVLCIGVVSGYALRACLVSFNVVEVKYIDGYADVNGNGDAIGFSFNQHDQQQEAYSIAGVDWKGPDNVYHFWTNDGGSCLKPLDVARKVRLGMIKIKGDAVVLGRNKVVFIECKQQ